MARIDQKPSSNTNTSRASSQVEELMLAALERGGDSLETGRYLITFKEGSSPESVGETRREKDF